MCEIEDFAHLAIVNGNDNSTQWKEYLETELEDWHRGYLPSANADLSGMGDIWDFGAGCGETAQLFLNHHADRVQCVEMNPVALKYLHVNFDGNPRVRINESRFGWGKFDIERGEWQIRFEAHDAAPGIKVLRKWDKESNTGLYGLTHSQWNTLLQTRFTFAPALHLLRIRSAHWMRLQLNWIFRK